MTEKVLETGSEKGETSEGARVGIRPGCMMWD